MIERVINPFVSFIEDFVVIAQKDVIDTEHNLIETGPTQGAVDTLLKAEQHMKGPIIIANCDQLVDLDVASFISGPGDGSFVTFKSQSPAHSYVKGAPINEIAEKKVISDQAMSGVYFFKDGEKFLSYCKQYLRDGKRVKGEYYVSGVIKLMIEDGFEFYPVNAPTAILGTPEDLGRFEVARSMPL